ncbi:MAG: hypothetical protein ACFFAS_14140 [Promethearchaeota archaeon]
MSYPLQNKKEELKEMIELIPKMQEAVRNGLKKHFQALKSSNRYQVKNELQSLQKVIEFLIQNMF